MALTGLSDYVDQSIQEVTEMSDGLTNFWKWLTGLNWKGVQDDWTKFTNTLTGAWGEITNLVNSPIVKWINDMFDPIKTVTGLWDSLTSSIQNALKFIGITPETSPGAPGGSGWDAWGKAGDAQNGGYHMRGWSGGAAVSASPTVDGAELTHFGYPGDPDGDNNSRAGIGDNNNRMTPLYSAAVKQSDAQKWGLHKGQVFLYRGHTYEYDDTIPESDPGSRVDVYDPGNVLFQKRDTSKTVTQPVTQGGTTMVNHFHFHAPIGQSDADYIAQSVSQSIRTAMV
jgi:hypothetical protein